MGDEEVFDDEIKEEEVDDEVREPEKNEDPYEALAVKAGYNPNYKGDDKKTAEQFILDTLEINKSLRKGYETATRKFEESTNKISSLENAFQKLNQFHEATRAAERQKAEAKIKELQQDRLSAIEDGDVKKVRKIESDINAAATIVRETKKKDAATPDTVENPIFDKWILKNDWYGKDPELTIYADEQSELPEFKGLPLNRLYERIEKRTKAMFPDKFQKPKATPTAPAVDGGGVTPPSKGSRPTFKDLSPARQKEVDDFISTVPAGTFGKDLQASRQKYVDDMVVQGFDFDNQD